MWRSVRRDPLAWVAGMIGVVLFALGGQAHVRGLGVFMLAMAWLAATADPPPPRKEG